MTFRISTRASRFNAAVVCSSRANGTPASTRAPSSISPLIPEKHSKYPMRIERIVSHALGGRHIGMRCLHPIDAPRGHPLSLGTPYLCAAPHQNIGWEHCVQGAGAEAAAVERYVLEAGLAQFSGNPVEHFHCECALQFCPRNLNARKLSVVPDTEFEKSELPQALFAALDLFQNLARHRAAVLDARRQTRRGRSIPKRVSRLFGQCADLLLGQAGF